MGLRIQNNVAALNSYNNVNRTDKAVSSSLEKLSSGYRINKAADDAAGLVISEGLRSQIGGLSVASRNAQDGVNIAQTADGALSESTSILQRMRDLAVQSASDTYSASARTAAQNEINSLASELTRISDSTNFNGKKLLDGNFNGKIQVGSGTASGIDTIDINLSTTGITASKVTYANGATLVAADGNATFTRGGVTVTVAVTASNNANTVANQLNADNGFKLSYKASVDPTSGGLVITATSGATTAIAITGALAAGSPTAGGSGTTGFSAGNLAVGSLLVDSNTNATAAITAIDAALGQVTAARGTIGALQNRFSSVINSINVSIENLTASESAIRDTDMAAEMTKFTKNQILSQAGTSMLAQANSSTQNILTLLRG